MAGFIARAVVLTPSGTKTSYSSGKALTQVEADNELARKIDLIVGQVLSASITNDVDPADYVPVSNTAQYEDLNLVMYKTIGLGKIYKSVKINNVSLGFKAGGVATNKVDESSAAILAFVAAFRDGNGVGGYVLDPGASTFDS